MKLDSIGTLFANSWRRLRERFVPAVQVWLVPQALLLISELLLTHRTPPTLVLGGIIDVLAIIASILASIALVSAVGKGTDFTASYRTGFTLFWSAIWIALLVALATIGGYVMLVIPGIMLTIQLSFASFALVLENRRGMNALTQSREYIKGYWWAFLGRILLMILMLLVVGVLILFLPATLLFGPTVGQIVYAIVLLIFVPFTISYEYEIFENLRRLKPEVASGEAAAKADRGFLKVAMVVGIVGALILVVLVVVGLIFLPTTSDTRDGRYLSGYGYNHVLPTSGPVGTMATITDATASGVTIPFDAANTILMNGYVAARDVAPAADDSLSFTVPDSLAPDCAPREACPQFLIDISSGTTYEVAVENSEGVANVGTFTVTGNGANSGAPAADGSD